MCIVGAGLYQWFGNPQDVALLIGDFGLVPERALGASGRLFRASGSGILDATGEFLYEVLGPALSYAPLHAGPIHALSNAAALWVFGSRLESDTSWWRYGCFVLLCALVGAVAELNWATDPTSPRVGASAVVGGVAVAYLLFHPRGKITMLYLPLPILAKTPAFLVAVFWGTLQFHKIQAFLGDGHGASIGYAAQASGCVVGGMVLAPLLMGFKRRKPTHKKKVSRARRPSS